MREDDVRQNHLAAQVEQAKKKADESAREMTREEILADLTISSRKAGEMLDLHHTTVAKLRREKATVSYGGHTKLEPDLGGRPEEYTSIRSVAKASDVSLGTAQEALQEKPKIPRMPEEEAILIWLDPTVETISEKARRTGWPRKTVSDRLHKLAVEGHAAKKPKYAIARGTSHHLIFHFSIGV